MKVICDCYYITLAMKILIPPEQNDVVHVVINSWQQASGVVLRLRQLNVFPVCLYLSSQLMMYRDVFYLLIPRLQECRPLSYFLKSDARPDCTSRAGHTLPVLLSRNDFKYLYYISMGYNINIISQSAGIGLKQIYNRRALLIRKLNLPNDNVLIMLSGVLLLLNAVTPESVFHSKIKSYYHDPDKF